MLYLRALWLTIRQFVTWAAVRQALVCQRGSYTVDVSFVHAFDDNIHILAQQAAFKLGDKVRMKRNVVGKSYSFERIGSVDMIPIVSRHQPTPLVSTPHSRRRVTFQDFNIADLIDDIDEVKMLISPQSDYAQNFARSRNRKLDDLIIAAFNASSVSVDNVDANSNVALGAGQIVASGGGSANFTMAKWRAAKAKLDAADVPPEGRTLVLSPIGLQSLLGDSTVTSADYNSVRALVDGQLRQYLGFDVVMSTRLPVTGTIRSAFAFQKEGMGLCILLDKSVEIDKRPDLNNSTQVLLKLTAGATRIEEALVVQIDYDEAL